MRQLFFKILIILFTVSFFKFVDAATFQVTTTADRNNGSCNAGDCSLREAVRAANANPNETHTILLKSGSTYSLTISGEDDTAEKGDLDLKGNLTIKPDGDGVATIDAGGQTGLKERLFHVLKDANVNLSNLVIQNGFLLNFKIPDVDPNNIDPNKLVSLIPDSLVWGAGIHNSGNLTLNQATVQKNSGTPINEKTMQPEPGMAVGISNDKTGRLILNRSIVTEQSGEFGAAGIINVKGEVTINDSQITSNIGVGSNNMGQFEMGIGVGVASVFGSVTVNNSLISKNNGNATATGIASAWSDLMIDKTIISANNAADKSAKKNSVSMSGIGAVQGNITIKNSKIINHQGSSTDPNNFFGFSYLNFSPNKQPINNTVIVQNSEISGNKSTERTTAIYDGHITGSDQGTTKWEVSDIVVTANESSTKVSGITSLRDVGKTDMKIQRVMISKNSAKVNFFGFNLFSDRNSRYFLEAVSITENQAGDFITGLDTSNLSPIFILNSTISNNRATNPGGFAGAVDSFFGGNINIAFSTLASNKGDPNKAGSSFGINDSLNPATFRFKGVIIADHAINCRVPVGQSLSFGSNLSSDDTCTFFDPVKGDVSKTDPLLAPLADNGGFGLTHALLDASPALNKIPEASCKDFDGNPVLVDQRGVIRPAGGSCDIGAFEKATIVVSLNHQTLRFPDTRVGESSPTQELILTNQEDAIQVSSSRLLGDHPEGFSVLDDQCSSKTLKKGETCSLKIQFNPKSEGEQTGALQLTIPANAAQSTVNLSGKAVAANTSLNPPGGGGGGCALNSEVSVGRIGFLFAIMTGFILVGFRRVKQNLMK